MKEIKIFGKEIIEEKTIKQLQNCLTEDSIGVLTADAHYGYKHPIGGCVGYRDKISPSGVGFDIACGNMAVKTNAKSYDVNIKKIMDEISQRISFGTGRPNGEPIDHPIFDKIRNANFIPQRKFLPLAMAQLGTVGGGNHYVDVFKDEDDFIWIGVHFGSRGFGHKTATGFIALSKGLNFEDRTTEGSMDDKPTLFDVNSELGQSYIEAMNLSGEYAYAGRESVVKKVLEILGNPDVTYSVHNHHNFAWLEEHFGEKFWVVRKGCTPAFPNQHGFIGSSMYDTSFIVEGVESENSKQGLYSTVHGAGRILSRTQAGGKKKWIRDAVTGKKRPQVVGKGLVDFDSWKKKMKERNIELRGSGADETPECYKNLEEVLQYQGDTIKILHRLQPLGVAMAGAETHDPYKD